MSSMDVRIIRARSGRSRAPERASVLARRRWATVRRRRISARGLKLKRRRRKPRQRRRWLAPRREFETRRSDAASAGLTTNLAHTPYASLERSRARTRMMEMRTPRRRRVERESNVCRVARCCWMSSRRMSWMSIDCGCWRRTAASQKGLILLISPFSTNTISPFSTYLTNIAPLISNEQVAR